MKKFLPLLFLLVSFGLYAQVPNDICATAINLGTLPAPSPCPTGGNATTYTYNGTTIGAAAENPYSSLTCMDAPAADVWVTFIASGNELDIAFTSGLNDANIGVYTGGCGGLIGLFCQASNNGNITTTLTPMEPGTQYWMQISGINATDFSNFTLNMTSVNNCSQCMLSAFVTASPAPTNGYYLPGTTVNLCLTVTGYNQIAANWMSGVQPTFGSGWNPATLSGTSAPNGSGSYGWYYADGPGSMGMGWYVDVDPVGPPGPDGNFANNYGDPSITGTNLNETFCFQITTDVACVPGASLNVSFNTYSDYETGGYGSPGCTGDPNISFVASTICCAVPLISAVGETCPGANNGSATAQGQGGASPYDYIWENPAGTVIYTNNNNAGVSSMSGLAAGTYTVTVTDNNGCVQIIDIVVPAALGCPIPNFAIEPVDVTVSCIGNVPAMTNLTWTDNCGSTGVVTGVNGALVGGACGGTITRTWTYTNFCGNSDVATQIITIDDNINPTGTAPANVTVQCIANVPAQNVLAITNEADNCSTPTVTFVSDVSAGTCPTTITRTYRITDACGNFLNVFQTITVNDNIAPTGTAPANVTVQCIANVPAQNVLAITNEADNCSTPTVTFVSDVSAGTCPTTITRTYRITDACGNFLNVFQTITVNDNIAPTGTAPANVTVQCVANVPVQNVLLITDEADNCSTPTVTFVSDVSAGTCPTTITRTYRITDACGNFINVTQTITVNDNIAPTGTAPANVIVQCPTDVPAANPLLITNEADNCSTPTVTFVSDVSVGTCPTIITRTYRITDACGNFIDVVQTITVDDTTPPTASNPPAQSGTPPPFDPTQVTDEADNCGIPTVTDGGDVSDNGVCPEIITRTYIITDACGNFITVTQTFSVGDAVYPTASNPADINVECLSNVPLPNPLVVTDEADNGLTPTVTFEDDTAGGGVCPDTIIRRYRVTDDCGNFIFVSQFIIIEPTTNPVVPANGSSTVNCLANAQVVPAAPVVTDVCGNALTPVVVVPADIVCEGTMAYTYTYTDCAGNSSVWTYTYTVDLPTFAIATAPGASTVNCPANAAVQPAGPGAVTDMCGNTLTPAITSSAAVACEGDRVWTFTYTDCASNVVAWTYTYTVDMPTFAIATAPGASTVNCPAAAAAQPAGPGVVNDMCGNTVTPVITSSAAVTCEGNRVWTFTYTDCASNAVAWTYTYTVDMPTFAIGTAPGASTVNCPANAAVQPAGPGVVTDMCGNTLTPAITSSAAVACEGNRVWTFTYTDCASNVVAWTYTYTVDIPTFTIPYANGASTVSCVSGAQVDPGDPGVVTDMCGNTLTPVVTAPSPSGCTGVGAVWTYTYTDCAGNTADWTHTYTINLAPFSIATAPGASTVNCSANAAVQPAGPGVVNDACGNVITPVITSSAAVACEGNRVWTFTYTDCAGNTAAWTYTYTVDMPIFAIGTLNGASTVQCIAQAIAPAPPAVNDVCGNAITPVMTQNANPACEGVKIYTFTYTDCAANVVAWTYTYTVDIPVLAIGTPNGASTVQCIAQVVAPVPPAVNDVCGNAIIPVMTENADPVCVGDKVYTFTYTDCAGSASIWTYTFSINDNVLPTASNPAPISVPLSLLSVLFPDPLVVIDEADNCTANPTVVWVSDVSDGNVCNLEEITRTYSVTDDCGNQIFVTQIITVLAVPAPIDAGPDATICAGEFITLEAVNPWGVPISWSPNNPPVDGVPFQPGSTQTYTVTAENLGCISTDSVTITLQELQLVSFIGDILSGCEPLTVTFTNTSTAPSGLVNCVWNINGQSLSGCGSVAYTFDNAGLYDVTLTTTSATGCVNSITYIDYIDVEAIPTASFNVSTTEVWDIDAQVDFTNTSVGASDYLWNFGNNSGSSILDNPSHTFLDLGVDSYQVELIAYSPLGCTDTAYRTISVLEELIYYVPNTFTPDGDNYNEYFKPIFTSGYDPYDFDLFIFNRWGEIIWESHDATVGWDGTYGGSVVQDGTYIWKIEFKSSETDKRIMKTGHVNIIK